MGFAANPMEADEGCDDCLRPIEDCKCIQKRIGIVDTDNHPFWKCFCQPGLEYNSPDDDECLACKTRNPNK